MHFKINNGVGICVRHWSAVLLVTLLSPVIHKELTGQDSIHLHDLQLAATASDPRTSKLRYNEQQLGLLLRNIKSEWYPSFSIESEARYQSASARFPSLTELGVPTTVQQDRDSYDATLNVQQRILDFSSRPRAAIERARKTEADARLETELYALQTQVNDAFFNAILLQERQQQIRILTRQLKERLAEAESRMRAGVVTSGAVATIKVAILQRRQDDIQLDAQRVGALEVLSHLTGVNIDPASTLALPTSHLIAGEVRNQVATFRQRPEFSEFAGARDRLSAEIEGIGSKDKPQLSAFGRAGYGRPGLNFLNDKFDSYWMAGLQFRWAPFTWGTVGREKEVLRVQRASVDADEAAFARAIDRATRLDYAVLARLEETLALDNEIVELRTQIEREARSQLDNGVLTTADYVLRNTELLQAKLDESTRRVERARVATNILNTLGHRLN